jgi:hypothetical protein
MAEVGDFRSFQNKAVVKRLQVLLGLLSSFTGGAFSHASIMALGIMPYFCFYYCTIDGNNSLFAKLERWRKW